MIQIGNIVRGCLSKSGHLPAAVRCIQTSAVRLTGEVAKTDKKDDQVEEKKEKPVLDEVSQKLMSFFDFESNWGKDEVRSGRAWRIEELRIKSNSDLHSLWFILYKERNMLLTMEEAAKDEVKNMASPERIDKVEESMKNIEEVVKERNKAYFQLEVGDDQYVERRRHFRQDIFGRWRWVSSSQHLIPYFMNTGFRNERGVGFGPNVKEFNMKLREKKFNKIMAKRWQNERHIRQLMKRFPDMDLEHVQELYPDVNVKQLKDNLTEYQLQDRRWALNRIFYEQARYKHMQ